MPHCFCKAHGCYDSGGFDTSGKPKGKFLDTRAFKTHSIADQSDTLRKAEERSNAAIDAQMEEIIAHLSVNILADNVSGPNRVPGGSLWSRESPELQSPRNASQSARETPIPHPPAGSTSAHSLPRQNGSRRSREDNVLSVLSDIEAKVRKLHDKMLESLDSVGKPSPTGPPLPFPLLDLLECSSSLRGQLDVITLKSPAVVAAQDPILRKLQEIDQRVQSANREWAQNSADIRTKKTPVYGIPHDTAHHYKPFLENVDPVLQITFFMVVVSQVILGVGRRGCAFLLQMTQYIIHLSFLRAGPNLSQRDQKVLSNVPMDIHETENRFSLENQSTIYAVCPDPSCHFLYAPKFTAGSPIPIYPSTCTHRQFKGGRKCGTTLLKLRRVGGHTVHIPIKPFVGFSFKDWLGGLLSRSGFEEKMDEAWKTCQIGMDPIAEMKDIFDGDMLRNFKGYDGQHFSISEGEGRYVFSLCVDFFNPLGNKQAGKKKSIGLISLVCLSLPPDMRYKSENMFLFGVVPGPKEPPLTCLNHYLHYLIDELLEFWFPGVRFSRTSNHYYGKVVQCALICVVSDLLAARKTNGFAAVNHTQACAICHCVRHSDDLGNSYARLWHRRTATEIRDSGQLYLNAKDEKTRGDTVKDTGIRWSELYRLPYFDPSRFVVVDCMHNLFLGLVQEHFEILGIRLNQPDDTMPVIDVNIPLPTNLELNDKERKSMEKLIKILQLPLNTELSTPDGYEKYFKRLSLLHVKVLESACQSLAVPICIRPGHVNKKKLNKADFTRSLLEWRRTQVEAARIFRTGAILTTDEMNELRSDIERMITPSWLTSVPSNLGEPSHGKLKADQWRILGTTYLSVSLTRLWSQPEADDERSVHCKKLLSVTLSLISAVIIASSRTTSQENADLYLHHMQTYLAGLRELFPLYKFLPNHHMALHLPEYLRLYGPVHSWWTFPFERLIGMLQRIPNNFQDSQLEATISRSFTKASNLRALLLKEGCPVAITNCHKIFSKLVDPQIRNSLLTDISYFVTDDETDEPPLEVKGKVTITEVAFRALEAYFQGKPPPVVKVLSSYVMDGLTFSTFKRHRGNSFILVRCPSRHAVPARIENVIQISSNEVLFVVQHFLKSTSNDPFQRYPVLQTSFWSDRLGRTAIVKPQDVICHFASLSLEWEGTNCMAVISLSREY